MSTEEKTLQLVQRLHAKTKSGEVPWERTSRPGTFQAAFPNHIVKLSAFQNLDTPDALDYVISVFDESGTILENASDVDLQKVSPGVKVFQLMEELYEAARRQALDVDSALDSLLSELS